MGIYRLESNISCAIFTKDQLDAFMEKLMENPFGNYQFLMDNTTEELDTFPFDQSLLEKQFTKKRTWDFTIHNNTDEGNFIEILMMQGKRGGTINVIAQDESLYDQYQVFYNYILDIVNCIPPVSSAFTYDANADLSGLYDELNLDFAPACFKAHLKWQHLLGPAYYTLFFTKEDLLNMPTYKVEELENGLINIVNYENPFDWNAKENKDRVVELTAYLNERDIFIKDF